MASSKFFKKLIKMINLPEDIVIRVDENEYFLWDYDNKKVYFYDFCIPELNVMIEYNGIMFHPRVKDTIFTTVEASTTKDNIKDALAKKNGFDLYWYWENIDNEETQLTFYKDVINYKYNEYRYKKDSK